MLRKFIDQFHFTRLERAGVISLLLFSCLCFVVPEGIRTFYPPTIDTVEMYREEIPETQQAVVASIETPNTATALFQFDPNKASVEDFVRLGLKPRVAAAIEKYRSKGGRFRHPEDFRKIYILPESDYWRLLPYIRIESPEMREIDSTAPEDDVVQMQMFDPNTVTEETLRRMGLSGKLASNWMKFREKGGFFRKKEDLKKLYALEASDYQRLEPYVVLPDNAAQTATAPRRNAPLAELDINAAGLDDWQQLPGIGALRARKIVEYRDRLGGFVSVEQVAETRGLPDSVFQQIRPLLVRRKPLYAPIDLNTAGDDDLSRHPYVSDKQAQLIVNYRQQHGSYAAVDDLKQILAFRDDVAWLEKIRPYLMVGR